MYVVCMLKQTCNFMSVCGCVSVCACTHVHPCDLVSNGFGMEAVKAFSLLLDHLDKDSGVLLTLNR